MVLAHPIQFCETRLVFKSCSPCTGKSDNTVKHFFVRFSQLFVAEVAQTFGYSMQNADSLWRLPLRNAKRRWASGSQDSNELCVEISLRRSIDLFGKAHTVNWQGCVPLEERLFESLGDLRVCFFQIVGLSDIFCQVK